MRSNVFAPTVLVLIVSAGTVSVHRLAHGEIPAATVSQGPDTPDPSDAHVVMPGGGEGRWTEMQVRRYEYEEDGAWE